MKIGNNISFQARVKPTLNEKQQGQLNSAMGLLSITGSSSLVDAGIVNDSVQLSKFIAPEGSVNCVDANLPGIGTTSMLIPISAQKLINKNPENNNIKDPS